MVTSVVSSWRRLLVPALVLLIALAGAASAETTERFITLASRESRRPALLNAERRSLEDSTELRSGARRDTHDQRSRHYAKLFQH